MSGGPDPGHLLRLAHSYQEKAQARIEACGRALKSGELDQAQFEAQTTEYRRELARASDAVARLQDLERARADTLAAELAAVREEQAHLVERVTSGQLTIQLANDRNRALLKTTERLEGEVAGVRARISADSAQELGGFVDLPFDQYAELIGAASMAAILPKAKAESGAKRWEVGLGLISAVLAVVAVFMPWTSQGGSASSLYETGLAVSQVGSMPAQGSLIRLAWLLYVLVPVLGFLTLYRTKGSLVGWGALVAGLLLFAGGVYPGTLAGASRVYGGDFSQLLAAYRPGAVLYLVCATVFIIVGAMRVSPWEDSLTHSLYVSALLAAGVAAVFLGLAAVFYLSPVVGRVTFEAAVDGPNRDYISVTCQNIGEHPITLNVPWPEGGPRSVSGGQRLASYGITVYVRERDSKEFHPVPYARQPWTIGGTPLSESGTVQVGPGMAVQLRFDLRQLSTLGADADSVRLQFSRGDGAGVGSFETDLSGRYLSPPGETREPLVIPKPNSTPVKLPATSNEAVAAPSESTKPAEEGPATGAFTYTGNVGGKAVVRFTGPKGGPPQTLMVGAGDPVAGGWSLDSISESPGAIVLKEDSGGRSVTIQRGESARLQVAP